MPYPTSSYPADPGGKGGLRVWLAATQVDSWNSEVKCGGGSRQALAATQTACRILDMGNSEPLWHARARSMGPTTSVIRTESVRLLSGRLVG